MRLIHLRVVNFRSAKHVEITFDQITTLLGPNNHGKSNLLCAVDFLLSPGVRLTDQDFFSERSPEDNRLTVEGRFVDLTDQEANTFRKYVYSDGSLTIQRWAELNSNNSVETGYRGYLEQPLQWWLQESAFDRLRSREAVEEAAQEVPQLSILLEEGGRITKDRVVAFQADFINGHRDDLEFEEVLEESPLLGVKNIAGGVLPDFYLVPAVRDLCDETRTVSTTAFGKLLNRAVSEMTTRDPRFLELQERLATLVNELNERPAEPDTEPASELGKLERVIQRELEAWGVDVSIEITPPEIRKIFELGTELWVDDGHRAQAERKGHGLQRAIIFSLIRAWASVLRAQPAEEGIRARAASDSLVFAFEEPELFLHPHAQRILAASLKTIAETPEHQVLVCTHSTYFVDLKDYRSIAIVRRPDSATGTTIKQCITDLFAGDENKDRKNRFHMAAWINPDRGELFFASKVVLVEGETEKVLLPYLATRLGCFDPSISLIDCGSKNNLPLYISILNAFFLEYIVVHDEDPVPDPPPDDWLPEKLREKKRTYEINAEIAAQVSADLGSVEVLTPDCEGYFGISRSQGGKKGKALAALDHFGAISEEIFPTNVVNLVRRIFESGS